MSRTHTIEGLRRNTVYVIKVLANNGTALNTASPNIYVKTLP